MAKLTLLDAITLVASAEFEPFEDYEYETFSGVRSDNPLIAYTGDLMIVNDDDEISIVYPDGSEMKIYFG
jgi:hypothetical protein